MYRFPWYLTLVSTNHASSNPGQVVEVEQKIIIRNINLSFQFSDHNKNLLVLKLWKSTKYALGHYSKKRSRGSTIKLYFFSCWIFLSKNFDVSFFVTLTILVWYINKENMMYLVIN